MTTTLTRADLANFVYREIGLSLSESSDLVDAVIEEISIALEAGEEVKLSSFGTFKIRHKKQRVGRNPKTGVEVPISPRNVLSFNASNILKKKVNDANSGESSSESSGGESSGGSEMPSSAPTSSPFGGGSSGPSFS